MIPHQPCYGFSLIFIPAAFRDLKSLNEKQAVSILNKIKELIAGHSNLDVKKLKSEHALYRLRVGNYRVIYRIKNACFVVCIIAVGHRKEIYQWLVKRI